MSKYTVKPPYFIYLSAPINAATKSLLIAQSSMYYLRDEHPFKLNKLTYCLYVGLLTSSCFIARAEAATTNASSSSDSQSDQQSQSEQQQLDQAMTALKLKQAVEKGNIDASVLEDYKRETLHINDNSNNTKKKKSDASKNEATPNLRSDKSTQKSNQIASRQPTNPQASIADIVEADTVGRNSDLPPNSVTTREQVAALDPDDTSRLSMSENNFDALNEMQKSNNAVDKSATTAGDGRYSYDSDTLNMDAIETAISDNSAALESPEQIEQELAQIEQQINLQLEDTFDAPVATLDARIPPLGFDSQLDQINRPVPVKPEATGLLEDRYLADADGSASLDASQPVIQSATQPANQSATKPVNRTPANPIDRTSGAYMSNETAAVGTGSTGYVPLDEDLTNLANFTEVDAPDKGRLAQKDSHSVAEAVDGLVDTITDKTATDKLGNIKAIDKVEPDTAPVTFATISDGNGIDADVVSANETDTIINPDNYLPEYQPEASPNALVDAPALSATDSKDDNKPSIIKRIYNRLFNGGVEGLPKISADIYLQDESRLDKNGQPLLVEADEDEQPIENIKAAMENITVQAIVDFGAVLPKLREEAINAAQAVGYYDISLRFVRTDSDEIAVIIERLGAPVRVDNRIVDIRGEGAELEEFQEIMAVAPPLKGEVLNQGLYTESKALVETTKTNFGFFDGRWLDSSIEVILPDNEAAISLIYDTENRYRFGEVVFFTLDENGHLTDDPDALPVKPEILHQLYDFESSDPYYAPLITDFTNDLAATRYFNTVNVESVLPTNATDNATLGFEDDSLLPVGKVSESSSIDGEDTLTGSGLNAETGVGSASTIDDGNINANTSTLGTDNIIGTDNIDAANVDTDSINAEDMDADLAPIEYSLNEETAERLQAIKDKAERLTRLPDDRVLDEDEEESKTFLGKVSNVIKNIAAKILPGSEDDDDGLDSIDELPDDLSETVLANRKTPAQVEATKTVPLYVFIDSSKPKDADFGIGYGTDTGVRTVLRLENNLVNREGYQAGMTVGLSGINQRVEVHGSRPWKHPLDDILTGSLSYERKERDKGKGNLDLKTDTILGKAARVIKNDKGWDRFYSVRYRRDHIDSGIETDGIVREDLPSPFNRPGSKFNQQALLFGYGVEKVHADDPLNPSRGWRQHYSAEVGVNGVLTDTNMAILRAGVEGIYSFGEDDKHQVLGSINSGYIVTNDFDEVPYELRFFAGGDRSIRGYDYESLSPLENGYQVGGQVLAVGSAEYNYEFRPKFRAAVFADVGNAYDKDFDADTKLGLGLGIRWASPVGPVRADIGAGVLENSIPVRLHVVIGSPLQ